MIITPLSALDTPSQLSPTKDNFPGLAHLFTFSEPTGSHVLNDAVGGVSIGHLMNTLTQAGDGTVTLSAAFSGTLATFSGAWLAPGTKKILGIFLSKPAAASASFQVGGPVTGSPTSANKFFILPSSNTNLPQIGDGAALFQGTAVGQAAGNVKMAHAVTFDPTDITGIRSYKWDGTTYTTLTPLTDLRTMASLTSLDSYGAINANLNPAMVAILYLTTLPTTAEIEAMLKWMHYNTFTLGNKTLYPSLVGRV